MKFQKSFHTIIKFISLSWIILMMGCFPVQPQNPTATPTMPGHFYPQEGSSFDIEFFYPPEWGQLSELDINLNDDKGKRTIKGGRILFADPSQGEDPCLGDPDDPDSIIVDCGDPRTRMLFRIWDLDLPSDWAEKQIEEELYYIDNVWDGSLVEDRAIEIDGMPVRMITKLMEVGFYVAPESYTTIIYFQKEDVGYLFQLYNVYPEDLNGEFHQAFLDILASMKFVE